MSLRSVRIAVLLKSNSNRYLILIFYFLWTHRKTSQTLDVYTELHNGDQLTLVLKNPAAQLDTFATTYGKATYNMMEPQSDKGTSKFFAIIKYFVS